MKPGHVVLLCVGTVILLWIALATRYHAWSGDGFHYRLDRWTGAITKAR
jgi:hypothetical protein